MSSSSPHPCPRLRAVRGCAAGATSQGAHFLAAKAEAVLFPVQRGVGPTSSPAPPGGRALRAPPFDSRKHMQKGLPKKQNVPCSTPAPPPTA